MKPTTKHYVEFLFPGAFFAETSAQEINARNPDNVKAPKGAYAFRFFDRMEMTESGEHLLGKNKNYSGTYYLGGTVYTVAQLKTQFPNEKILISNVEGNGYKKAIRCCTGNWQPFDKNDVLIAEPKFKN